MALKVVVADADVVPSGSEDDRVSGIQIREALVASAPTRVEDGLDFPPSFRVPYVEPLESWAEAPAAVPVPRANVRRAARFAIVAVLGLCAGLLLAPGARAGIASWLTLGTAAAR